MPGHLGYGVAVIYRGTGALCTFKNSAKDGLPCSASERPQARAIRLQVTYARFRIFESHDVLSCIKALQSPRKGQVEQVAPVSYSDGGLLIILILFRLERGRTQKTVWVTGSSGLMVRPLTP